MKKILVTEDDKFLANAMRVKLSKAGFDVTVATDGVEAIEAIEKNRPDLVLLDMVMPRQDGFATLEIIRKRVELKDMPVIVTSNLGQKEDIDRAMKLGANGYLVKSEISIDKILEKINMMLRL